MSKEEKRYRAWHKWLGWVLEDAKVVIREEEKRAEAYFARVKEDLEGSWMHWEAGVETSGEADEVLEIAIEGVERGEE